jgi:2-oxoglutarate dehydrogenase E2 component (dihydrolipoamide succinyltransferase)
MSTEVRVPQLPESVADATLVNWHKQPGDTVSRDENLADLETDKVVLEVPAPVAGTLAEIRVATGAVVTSGQVLAVIAAGTAAGAAAPGVAAAAATATAAAEAALATAAPIAPAAAVAAKLSPAARRVIEEQGLDPARVAGSGRDGRITKADAESAAMAAAPAPAPAPAAAAAARTPPAAPAPQPAASRASAARGEQRVPMTRLRQRIAERLVAAQASQALLTTFNEVDLHALNELRTRYRDAFEKQHGVRLGFMGFFVKACVAALERFPVVNAAIDGHDIVYHDYFDIGVAVSTDRGLIVPVLRDADQLGFGDIEKAVSAYAKKAREGSITIEELTGGTFSITNGGVFGSLLSTPIVNAPQSAILGMHKVQERPVVVAGQVVVRPMMYLALTYDHRIIDGREAVQFLVAVKEAVEDPARLLLAV